MYLERFPFLTCGICYVIIIKPSRNKSKKIIVVLVAFKLCSETPFKRTHFYLWYLFAQFLRKKVLNAKYYIFRKIIGGGRGIIGTDLFNIPSHFSRLIHFQIFLVVHYSLFPKLRDRLFFMGLGRDQIDSACEI